ncbi:MAG: DUF480 domain-containing protein [Pirellulales bacterium]
MNQNDETSASDPPRWQPLAKLERRVLGVLVEKAKTTPENYPLSLNALVSGCNQKSNRSPQMHLDSEQVEEVLDRLRKLGALAEIQGGHRIDKYRHLLYDWLVVGKEELAVMAELLLRGAQTLGELRGRAARMEPIAGISELRPILAQLQEKGLIEYLTPQGRGCIVTHALYQPQELERLRAEHGGPTVSPSPAASHSEPSVSTGPAIEPADPVEVNVDILNREDRQQLESLQSEVTSLRQQLTDFRQQVESTVDQLRRDLEDLNRQLGN